MAEFTLAEIANLTETKLIGNPHHKVCDVASLDLAKNEDVSFLANPRYRESMKQSEAGVICIDLEEEAIEGKNFLISKNPSHTFQQIIQIFSKEVKLTGFTSNSSNIHPSAKIDPTVKINPLAVIDENATIGKNTFIGSLVYIGPNVQIGEDCIIHPGVIIREDSIIKDRVILQPNAVIGSCGFGYLTDEQGIHQKVDQVGNVIIEDDVEIGANTTIDRARFSSTIIKKGTKIDNLVQIAHNCELGPFNLMAAQTGIAGSTKTGSYVICGGQVGIAGHVDIESHAMIASRSGISKSLKSGKYRGSPAMPIGKYNRHKVYQRQLETYIKKIDELEKKINEIEEKTK